MGTPVPGYCPQMAGGKRERFAQALMRTGVLPALLGARAVVRHPWLTVLTYHRIAEPGEGVSLDDGVIDATPAQLDAQLATLKQHYTFVGADEVVGWLHGGRLPANPLLVTFDDGYLECATVALPILRRHGARAIFFLPTSFLDERRMFWWDHIAWLVAHAKTPTLTIDYPRPMTLDLVGARDVSVTALLDTVKRVRELDLPRFLAAIEAACGVSLDAAAERKLIDQVLMTWDQVRTLVAAGMDVGSHTVTHRVLQTLAPDVLARELGDSRRILEERTGARAKTIAYPVGFKIAHDPALVDAVRAAGYLAGFTNATGLAWTRGPRRAGAFDLPRVAPTRDQSLPAFLADLTLPMITPRFGEWSAAPSP